jgi:hypothetical protein
MKTPLLACAVLALLAFCCPETPGQKKEDIAPLIKKLKSPFSSDVTAAAKEIEKKGLAAKEAIPALAEALKNAKFADERTAIARALEKMGLAAKSAVPALTETLKDKAKFSEERIALARTLGKLGPAARSAVPVLAAALKTGFSEDRIAAAQALGNIGAAAKGAKPALTEAAKTGFADVQKAAAAALAAIQSQEKNIGIKDDAKFFDAKAVEKALDKVYALAYQYKIDLFIDTVAEVPADKKANVKVMTARERGQFFSTWAQQRARAAKVNGLYLLICRQPGNIQVAVAAKFRKVFDDRARNRLRDLLVKEFKARKFDTGLEDGVALVENQLAKSARK